MLLILDELSKRCVERVNCSVYTDIYRDNMQENVRTSPGQTWTHCTLYLVLLNTWRIIVHTILNLRIIFVLESRGEFLPEFECVRNSENVSN